MQSQIRMYLVVELYVVLENMLFYFTIYISQLLLLPEINDVTLYVTFICINLLPIYKTHRFDDRFIIFILYNYCLSTILSCMSHAEIYLKQIILVQTMNSTLGRKCKYE